MNKPSADGLRRHLAQRDFRESDNFMAISVMRMQLIDVFWANRTDGQPQNSKHCQTYTQHGDGMANGQQYLNGF